MDLDIEVHRKKMVERNLEKEFKDPDNPFRLAIVCAMWITGFDAQCVSTVYLDKPIKGHTLMQTIARANRVYDDEKENGLIVDYGNVYEQLEKAYSKLFDKNIGVDVEWAIDGTDHNIYIIQTRPETIHSNESENLEIHNFILDEKSDVILTG